MIRKKIGPKSVGKRLDQFAHALFPEVSRATIQKVADQGRVLVNKLTVKSGYKLKKGDSVTIDFSPSELNTVPAIDLPIIYEDDDCLVINKPTGVLTHSKGAFNPEATVATFIRDRVKDIEGDRAGIVHRLDRGTSGVIICAKHEEALKWLQKQFAQRRTKKSYLAIAGGELQPVEAVIDMPIGRNPKRPQTFRTHHTGKPAQTHYKVLKSLENGKKTYSLVSLKPVTGRTHQLRVHLAHLGHPIVGDHLYGGEAAPRLMLHAAQLEVTLPNKSRKIFDVPPPKEFGV